MIKTCIISGINGQLGQFLVKYLHENEPDVQVIGTIRHKSYDNQPYIFDKSKVIFELMDLSDAHSIENLILKYKPDYFINTAANAYVGESWKVPCQQFELNTIGVLHQLEAIRKHSSHTRYFNMGTSEEFGSDNNDGKLQDEDTKIDPKSPYGCAKAAARYLVNTYRRSYNLYALQGWTFNFESELRGDKYVTKKITKGVARIYNAIKNNQPFEPIELGNLDSYRSWQFCGDVADGIWRQLNQENYREDLKHVYVFGVGNTDVNGNYMTPEIIKAKRNAEIENNKIYSKKIKQYVMSATNCNTVRTFVEYAFKAANIEGYWDGKGLEEKYLIPNYLLEQNLNLSPVLVKINPEFMRLHDVTYLNGDATLIKKELGWKSTLTFEELVKRMVDWDIKSS